MSSGLQSRQSGPMVLDAVTPPQLSQMMRLIIRSTRHLVGSRLYKALNASSHLILTTLKDRYC